MRHDFVSCIDLFLKARELRTFTFQLLIRSMDQHFFIMLGSMMFCKTKIFSILMIVSQILVT